MIGHDVALVLAGMAAGVAACLATGVAVRVALGPGRPQALEPARPMPEAAAEQIGEMDIAIVLAAVAGFAKSR